MKCSVRYAIVSVAVSAACVLGGAVAGYLGVFDPVLTPVTQWFQQTVQSHNNDIENSTAELEPPHESVSPFYVAATLDLTTVPEYSGSPVVEINGNQPEFLPEQLESTEAFELYSPLDHLGRAGVAFACLGPETMPNQSRGDISMIEPSGWNSDTYVFIDGGFVFNRCHLVAHALSAENANAMNLVTGTRYLNKQGMLPYEQQVISYIESTGNHVLYRSSPIFVGDELLCRGIQMEAISLEDNGAGVCFNIFCYNVQPTITIDYATGATSYEGASNSEEVAQLYVLNTNSMKYHLPDCKTVKDISPRNRQDITATPSDIRAWGYKPCGVCKP
ncbi:MAG: DNA/RNA non-specific endonuclease [Coriobacteriales bacterium]|nr:DNA/RNA non-specific endonuclease [Coriobacteriales bacterium]